MRATSKPLSQAVVDYDGLANYWADRLKMRTDEKDDLYQEGMLALCKSYSDSPQVVEEPALASDIFRKAMLRYNRKQRSGIETIELETIEIQIVGPERSSYWERVYTKNYLDEIERMAGHKARRLVQELIEPSEETIREAVAETQAETMGVVCSSTGKLIEDPQEDPILLVDSQTGEVRSSWQRKWGLHTVRVKAEHVRKTLRISRKEWSALLAEVRAITISWLGSEAYNEAT